MKSLSLVTVRGLRPPIPRVSRFALAALLLLSGCNSCSKPGGASADAAPSATTVPDAAPVNASPLPTSSVAALVNPQNLPAYVGPTGSIEGTIYVTGPAASDTPVDFKKCPGANEIYGKAFREGQPKMPGGPRPLGDAVVAVTGYEGFYVQEKAEAAVTSIEGCGFAKRTVTSTFGQRLEVKNNTKDFWTPQLEPAQSTVMMMATPGGDPVKLYPKKPGHYRLVDHDRKWAAVDFYVFLHPLHTSSAVTGSYRIDGIPVGKVKVNTMHPQVNAASASADVEVKAGIVHHVDLTLEHKPKPDAGPPEDAGFYPKLH